VKEEGKKRAGKWRRKRGGKRKDNSLGKGKKQAKHALLFVQDKTNIQSKTLRIVDVLDL